MTARDVFLSVEGKLTIPFFAEVAMIDVEFKIKGKTVDPDDIGDGVRQTVLKMIRDFIREDLADVRCPVHDKEPEIFFEGEDLNTLGIKDFGCCNALKKSCQAAIKAHEGASWWEPVSFEISGEQTRKTKQKFRCEICQTERFHKLQFAKTTGIFGESESNKMPYWFLLDVWMIWKCSKCGRFVFESAVHSPGWFEGDWDETDYEFIGSRSMVSLPTNSLTDDRAIEVRSDDLMPRVFAHVPKKIYQAYGEIVRAHNNELWILGTVGLRSVLEEIADDKKVAAKNEYLRKKIQMLTTLGLSEKLVQSLEGVKVLGDRAAHQLVPAKKEDLRVAIYAVEEILNFVYELEPKTKQLNRHRKKRASKKPNANTKP